MADIEYPNSFSIRVALNVLKHISTGIYRDLAGSLKELVNNAYDAEAHNVWIRTDAPDFKKIVVEDDGRGMAGELFERAFKHVGASLKSLEPELYTSETGRLTVGKFGIGFLAAAHMSRKITVQSFTDPDKPGIEARMDLDPFFRYVPKVETLDAFKFGDVVWGSLANPERKRGTILTLNEVDKSRFHYVISRMANPLVPWPKAGETEPTPGKGMEDLVSAFADEEMQSVVNLSGREQILWNLGMICPVEYLDVGPIRQGTDLGDAASTIEELRKAVAAFRFQVWYDGVQVRKPILFPTPPPSMVEGEEEQDPEAPKDVKVRSISLDTKPEHGGKRVRAKGYIVYQPYRVLPTEMRGLLPRIRYVGVGPTYENSLLRRLKGERPLYRVQLSGELYITEGLDDELNLDRSGFLEVAIEYQALLSEVNDFVWSFIQDVDKVQGARRRRRARKKRDAEEASVLAEIVEGLTTIGVEYQVHRMTRAALKLLRPIDYERKSAYPSTAPIVVLDHSTRTVNVPFEDVDPVAVIIVVAADRIMEGSDEKRVLRKALADDLRGILR